MEKTEKLNMGVFEVTLNRDKELNEVEETEYFWSWEMRNRDAVNNKISVGKRLHTSFKEKSKAEKEALETLDLIKVDWRNLNIGERITINKLPTGKFMYVHLDGFDITLHLERYKEGDIFRNRWIWSAVRTLNGNDVLIHITPNVPKSNLNWLERIPIGTAMRDSGGELGIVLLEIRRAIKEIKKKFTEEE